MFDFSISKIKFLKNLLFVAKAVTLKQNVHSSMYSETRRQEKAAHTNNHAEKEVASKLITSCCNCCYLLFLWFDTWKKFTQDKICKT